MDTSFWIKCNPEVTIDHPVKKYFGRYLYRLTIKAIGGRLIDAKGSIKQNKQRRIERYKNVHAYSWFARQNQNIELADVSLLIQLRALKEVRKDLNILFRIEEPVVNIYAESNEQLQQLVEQYLQGYESTVSVISGPKNTETEHILNSGAIIRKKDNGYKYKVILRDGQLPLATRTSILDYLENLGNELVHIPHSTYVMLRKEHGWIWNCYFFTNDIDILSFLSLISPGLVSNYHSLVIDPDK